MERKSTRNGIALEPQTASLVSARIGLFVILALAPTAVVILVDANHGVRVFWNSIVHGFMLTSLLIFVAHFIWTLEVVKSHPLVFLLLTTGAGIAVSWSVAELFWILNGI